MISAAIFDLDGTLFTGHVWQGFSLYLRRHRRNRLWLYAFLATHVPLGFLYRVNLMDGGKMRLTWSRHMSWMLRGMSVVEGTRAFTWVTDEYVMPLLRPDVAALLREHRAQGRRVILLSGAFQPLLEIVGRQLGAQVVIGTQPEQRDGRYTGRALEPVCQGEGKAARLRAYLAGEGSDVDPSACSAYADSIFDLPVLEMVGHPVAVYPDEELAATAMQRGWSIYGRS
jgi:HAD superfamily hydrolase (TIGR01490 family)